MTTNDVAFPIGTPVTDFRLIASGQMPDLVVIGLVLADEDARRVEDRTTGARSTIPVRHLVQTTPAFQDWSD